MIGVSELCKGCGECMVECGDHEAIKMVPETETINARNETVMKFMDLLPETSQKFLGKYDASNPADNKAGVLQNHLMVRSNYEAFVSGDGSCAGCGEKSILRGIATLTEAYMRTQYHQKADRLLEKVAKLKKIGKKHLKKMSQENKSSYIWWTTLWFTLILQL